jgi:uncharacterized membrane protein YcfT
MAQAGAAIIDTRRRIGFVDYAKGLCIVLVVTMHSTLGVGEAMGGEGFMHSLVAFARPFRMPDFFLIAGLFAAQSLTRDWRTFLDRKLLHFGYFYLLWALIQCAIKSVAAPEGALTHFGNEFLFSLIEPFGTLWFIYLLPIFFIVTRCMRNENPLAVLLFAAILETLRIDTGWTVIDEFARRYVYFYSGYLLAPYVFRFAEAVVRRKTATLVGLALWAVANAVAVKSPGLGAGNVAAMPVVSLALGYAGALAIVAVSALLSDGRRLAALGWLGSQSIVVYLAFFLPMAITRTLLVRTGVVDDIGVVSLAVTAVSIVIPLLIASAVRGSKLAFLFERPAAFRLAPARARTESSLALAALPADPGAAARQPDTKFYP